MEQLPRLWDHWYVLARSVELLRRTLTCGQITRLLVGEGPEPYAGRSLELMP